MKPKSPPADQENPGIPVRSLSSLAPKPPSSSSGSRLYPPLPASEESFIHQAIRELQTDPDTINKMYEKFSQQIISDMKRKANHGVTVRKESMNTDISPDPSFWGTVTSLPTRTTPVNGSLKGSLVADTGEDKFPTKPESSGSKGWRAAKKMSSSKARRESTFSSNLFNLFVQSKRNDFRTTTVRERQLRGPTRDLSTLPTTHLSTPIVNERHDLNAARRAQTVFPFSKM